MKLLLPLLLLSASPMLFGQSEKNIETEVKEVKLHLTGGEALHVAKISLVAGKNSLVFTGLSPKINAQSVRVENIDGKANILSITSKVNFMKEVKKSKELLLLEDSLSTLQLKFQENADLLGAYNTELAMLSNNLKIGGENNGVTTAELTKMADFFRSRHMELNLNISRIGRDQKKTQERISQINRQFQELNSKQARPTSEVYVVLDSKLGGLADFELKYVMTHCGWSPMYDLLAEDISKPLTMRYRAMAYNNTGVDWNNVKVSLTSADPLRSASQPQLTPWALNYYSAANMAKVYDNKNNYYNSNEIQQQSVGRAQMNLSQSNSNDVYAESDKATYSAGARDDGNDTYVDGVKVRGNVGTNQPASGGTFQTIELGEMDADFDIPQLYTIPSDDKPYSMDIITHTLKATYKHYAVPKMEKDVFLLAQVTGWEDLSLISGPINVFNGGRYIGRSFLDTRNLSDTLDLSLGRDQKVLVSRVKKEELSSKQTFSGNRKVTYAYQLSVKNNHPLPISLELLDQIPVSEQKDIVVSLNESSGANLDPSTGILKWDLKVAANEKKVQEMGFSVKHPANREVKFKKVSERILTPRYF